MNILALDPATNTGWAIMTSDGDLLQSGVWHLSKDLDDAIWQLYNLVSDFEVEHIVFELMSVFRGGNTTRKLVSIEASIRLAARSIDATYTAYRPSEWRKVLQIGSAKHEALQFVEDWYGHKCGTDEADAICIGRAYAIELDTARRS